MHVMSLRRRHEGIEAGRHRARGGRRPLSIAALVAALLCIVAVLPSVGLAATADPYEPDDSYLEATPIAVGDTPQQHSIYPEGDIDWVAITVEAGRSYAIETAAGAVPDDPTTELRLFDSDGVTLLDSAQSYAADDYPRLEFTADADETLYANVQGWYEGTYAISTTLIGDAYEPDGSVATANEILPGDGPQQHSIVPDEDEDWVSFSVADGWRYTIETAPGSTLEDPDTILELYEADGTTRIDIDDDSGTGYFSRLVYETSASKTVYARVTGWDTGTYALSLTYTPILRLGVLPSSLDFGEVAVGDSLQRTIVLENQGVAPVDVTSVELAGAGFAIVRDEAGGTSIPVGGSAEIDIVYSPTVAYTGEPVAVAHDWTSLIAEYNYAGGTLVSVSLYTGFQNEGGAGNLDWRVGIGAGEWSGSGAVVPGGRYNMRSVVSAGSGSLVEVLEPVSDSFSNASTGTSLLSIAYLRVPEATLTIESNDDDEPTIDVGLFGVAVGETTPDTTPPTTTVSGADTLWHNADVTLTFTATDDEGGSGMVGGEAKTEYQIDGGDWVEGTTCTVTAPGDHSGDGLRTVLYRSTDAAGNTETAKTATVKIDTTPPAGTFVLEGDAATTSTLMVSGDSAVTEPNGPLEMRFSTDAKATWSDWEAYAASTVLVLSPGAGTKTVYAQYRDAAGNVLELSDSIEAEGDAPVPVGLSISPTWEQTSADGRNNDALATALRTVYTTGQRVAGASDDLHLAKYVGGALSWERRYDGPAHGGDEGKALAARGSAVYTAGSRATLRGDTDLLLVRWNSAGDRVWVRAYDSGTRLDDYATDVAVDGDGNVTVIGVSSTPATGQDWVVISYKADGTRRWVRRYDGPAHLEDAPAKMLLDSAGRIYIAGSSDSALNGTDAFVAKYSATGSRLWVKRFNGTADSADRALALRARPGGGVYVAGSTNSLDTGEDGLLLAYTAAGSRLFVARDTDGLEITDQRFNDLEVLPGGDIICGGAEWSPTTETLDRFYATFSPAGERRERAAEHGEWSEEITALAKDGQGGVYLTGTMGTEAGTMIATQRVCAGGTEWRSEWPSAPGTHYEATAIATRGVNAFIVGHGEDGSQVVIAHVY